MSSTGRPGDGRDDTWRDSGTDPTRPLPAQPPPPASRDAASGTWEAEVPGRSGYAQSAGTAPPPAPLPEEDDPSGRGRQVLFGVLGVVVGFVLAFIVIALATDDPQVTDPGAGQTQERIEELEADLAERDRAIEELEARLADAEAAAGESDADIEEQRQALDDRAAALDERADALDAREAELDEREADLAEREQQAPETPETPEPSETDDPDTPPDGGLNPPDIDEQDVENIVDRVLERLRELFN